MKSRILTAVVTLAMACGAQNKDNSQKKEVSSQEAQTFGKSLPQATIIRVPLNAKGEPMNDAAEMRTAQANGSVTADQLPTLFSQADAPANVLEELNATSSTESFGWKKYKYKCGDMVVKIKVKKKHSCGCQSACNPCDPCGNPCDPCGGTVQPTPQAPVVPPAPAGVYFNQMSTYWTAYQPTYNYYGYSYLYQYQHYYNQPNYLFFYYTQQFSAQGYNSYGWNQSMQSAYGPQY